MTGKGIGRFDLNVTLNIVDKLIRCLFLSPLANRLYVAGKRQIIDFQTGHRIFVYRIKIVVLAAFVVAALCMLLSDGALSPVRGQQTDGSLSAPTGVAASDGDYSTKIGISWNAVRGATTYRIFRNTTNNSGSATDVGTTPAGYFFDPTAVQNQLYFFWVRAENSTATSALSLPDPGLRANGNVGGPIEPLEPPPMPSGNPITAAKASLGKALFWDEQMSSTRTVACGTCHRPAEGGSDPRTGRDNPASRNPGPDATFGTLDDIFGSPGVPQNNLDGTYTANPLFGFKEQVTGRRAPTYLNAGYAPNGLFWDGRATDAFRDQLTNIVILPNTAGLESQTAGPPVSSAEMAHTNRNWTHVAERITSSRPLALATNIPVSLSEWIDSRTYPQLFEEAFGTPEVTPARISMAIATHERTLFSDRTPLDRFLYQIEPLTPAENRGRNVFQANQCTSCHDTALLSNHGFHNIGVRPQADDPGRFGVTGQEIHRGSFKTPNLRNVELHAPFMHNGGLATLEDVVDFYDRGGDHDAPNIDRDLIRPLNLTLQEKADLVAFLKRPLTDPRVRDELPPFDRPRLYTESNRVPTISGRGRPGSKFVIPEAVAIAPPIIGNPNFTVGVARGYGRSEAILVIGSTDPGLGTTPPTSGSFAYQTITLSDSGALRGYGSVSLGIPNDTSLIGQTFYGRWYVRDLRAIGGWSVSRLITFTIF